MKNQMILGSPRAMPADASDAGSLNPSKVPKGPQKRLRRINLLPRNLWSHHLRPLSRNMEIEQTVLVVIDVQGNLAARMYGHERLFANLDRFIRIAQVMN